MVKTEIAYNYVYICVCVCGTVCASLVPRLLPLQKMEEEPGYEASTCIHFALFVQDAILPRVHEFCYIIYYM